MSKKINVDLSVMDVKFKISCRPEDKINIHDAADLVNDKIKEIKKRGKTIGNERIVLMVALNIASDLLDFKKNNSKSIKNREHDKAISSIIERIEHTLGDLGAISV